MKARLLRLAVAAAALVTVPALADAPAGQYDQFTEADTTIHDTKTLLTWQRAAGAPAIQTLAGDNCSSPLVNMRLPTVKELLTLVDESPHQEYQNGKTVAVYADQQAFGGIDATQTEITPVDHAYWTATPGGAGHWAVDFRTGLTATADDSTPLYVRCVK